MDLGDTARDRITGFQGVVTGIVQYISGCHQALVVPPVKDGALVEPQWFDLQRLQIMPDPRIVLENSATPGCDRAAPKR